MFGPSGETRTPGILLPKQARYQLRYTRLSNFPIVVKHVVKVIFRPVTSEGESAVNADAPRLCGISMGGDSNPGLTLPKQARYQLRYTRLWNCFICGLSCGLGRFLTNDFTELVPASGSVPAGCGVGLFPSWMGGICSQSKRATNCATPGYSVFLHDTTRGRKKQVSRVCGRRCGQARFCRNFSTGKFPP